MYGIGFHLDYSNSYQGFSYLISHKAYGWNKEKWVEINGVETDIDETAILNFEKIFSGFLKTAYVDVLNAEISDLRAWRYEYNESIMIIHKIIWRHLSNKISFIILLISNENEKINHLEGDEINTFFTKSGIKRF